jgi:hypothetical protein
MWGFFCKDKSFSSGAREVLEKAVVKDNAITIMIFIICFQGRADIRSDRVSNKLMNPTAMLFRSKVESRLVTSSRNTVQSIYGGTNFISSHFHLS